MKKNPELNKIMSDLGKKGGKKSKRTLTTEQAKQMSKIRWKGVKRGKKV